MMQYEIHITVDKVTDIEKFKLDCSDINIKPIVIETQNKSEFEKQVMTSSKHTGETYTDTLNKISTQLIERGYEVVRKKVETKPMAYRNKGFIYYETHFRLLLPKEDEIFPLEDICKSNKFHLSKNLFKQDDNYNYQMCTFRSKDLTIRAFNNHINKFSLDLLSSGFIFDKIEIEECIYDTNELIDKNWLSNKYSK